MKYGIAAALLTAAVGLSCSRRVPSEPPPQVGNAPRPGSPAASAPPAEPMAHGTESAINHGPSTAASDPATRRFGPCAVHGTLAPKADVTGPSVTKAVGVDAYKKIQLRRTIHVGHGYLSNADLSRDGRWITALSDSERQLRIYDAQTGKLARPLLRLGPDDGSWDFRGDVLFWSDVDGRVLVARADGLFLVDDPSAGLVQLSEHGAWHIQRTRDGSLVGATLPKIPEQTAVLTFYAPAREGTALELRMQLNCEQRVDGWAISADQRLLALNFYPSDTLSVFDLVSGRELFSLAAPKYAGSVDLSPDGRWLAIGGAEVWLIDLQDPNRRATFTRLGNNVASVRFSPDSSVLAVSAYDGKARLLAASMAGPELELIRVLAHAGTANVYEVVWSGDGTQLLTSSGDRTLRLWGM